MQERHFPLGTSGPDFSFNYVEVMTRISRLEIP